MPFVRDDCCIVYCAVALVEFARPLSGSIDRAKRHDVAVYSKFERLHVRKLLRVFRELAWCSLQRI